MKMFILGIDGASYHLVNKYVANNKMPVFKRILEQGHFRKLIATNPPHTAPGWTSAFTGVGPGKHGIFQFWDTQAPNYVGKFMGRDEFDVMPVWDILNKCQIKTGMINVPMTYPPRKVDGFIITWPLSNTLRYAYPDDILFNIAKQGGHYASDLSIMYDGNLDYINKAIKITNKRVKTLNYIIQNYEWDFLVSVFTEIDRISHFYWHFMDELSLEYNNEVDDRLKNAIESIYCETDKALGRIIEQLPDDALVMIISDHGFGVGDINFYVQSFLLENSLLSIKKVHDYNKTAFEEENSELVVNSWVECIYDGQKHVVDWDNTVAFMAAPGSYGINVNLKGRQLCGNVELKDYEDVRNTLIKVLSDVRHPNNGLKLFRKVCRREEIYRGESICKAPDIILVPQNYSTMVHHAIKPGQIFGSPEHKGMHTQDGIVGFYGREMNDKELPSYSRLEDITPTILSYYGIDIPSYMDGKPIIEFERDGIRKVDCLSEGVNTVSADEYAYTESEMREAEKKLKSLGYL